MQQCRLLKSSLRCSALTSRCLNTPVLYSRSVLRLRSIASTSRLAQSDAISLPTEVLNTYKQSLNFPPASRQQPISELVYSQSIQGETVTLHGYLGHVRTPSKNLAFVEFFGPELDRSMQIVSLPKVVGQSSHDLVRHCRPWTPAVIKGQVKSKASPTPTEREGDTLPNEIELLDLQILNNFPLDIDPSAEFGPEQRHLQLKSTLYLRRHLQFRSRMYHAACGRLIADGYQHIETPLLFKSTSEGAREFLVPTRRQRLAYALPQSPQQYKQLLIASGIPKYFQIARCFRDEDLRADRQPEFTQLDLERAFASGQDIMSDVEKLIKDILREAHLQPGGLPDYKPDEAPFKVLTYHEVMSKFGTDKPDLRLGYTIEKIDHLLPVDLISKISSLSLPAVDISILKGSDSFEGNPSKMQRFVAQFLDSPQAANYHNNPDGGPGIFVYDSRKPLSGLQAFGFEAAEEIERLFEPEDGDLIVLQARPNTRLTGGSTALGRLMVDLNRAAVQRKLKQPPTGLEFLWVIDFPLFTPIAAADAGQSVTASFQSTHHPFTSPKTTGDVDLLTTDPQAVIADHYDLVLNGVEIGGGSRRIHQAAMQRLVLEDILRLPKEKVQEFDHLLEALRAGCPPHAGFALGFDRFVTVLLGRESVRDVIAFPKWGKGDDPMVKAPARIEEKEWEVYKLQPISSDVR